MYRFLAMQVQSPLSNSMVTNTSVACLSENSEALRRNADGDVLGQADSQWYALQTYPRHEKRVRDRLIWSGVESFLPLYERINRWKNGCNMRLELPLFPNYLFVKIALRRRARVLNTPGVVSLVGAGFQPWPLPNGEIEALRDGLHLRRAQPHPYLVMGHRTRIKAGPLQGLSGILVRRKGDFRVVLSIDLLMQSVSVEVGVEDVEPADKSPKTVELGQATRIHNTIQATGPMN
jgi:transcription antitermination factor NusG